MTAKDMDATILTAMSPRLAGGVVLRHERRVFLAGMRAAAEYLTSIGEFGHSQDIISIADELGKP